MARKLDLTGERYGRLVIVSPAPNKGKKTFWNCLCDCGEHTVASTCNLRRGDKVSCGCYAHAYLEEKSKNAVRKTRLYKCWSDIKKRCFNANSKVYAWYGARGITMCDEWANSFPVFRDWAVGNGYSEHLTIDRIDVNGNYEPSNCRWATPKEQCNNRSTNRLITINGTTKTVAQWAHDVGIHEDRIHNRLKRGWNEHDAVMLPLVSGVKYKNRRCVCTENTKED